ncbi:uncharacterized protein LOC115355899 [Myripristis murdjan]|uniref:uncharacterized protein LOC115355899 n=1 Tax=Myripristis murdjan TaxID=586833 RepID=UPI001175F610|nr:uncharacterized protein LOC115355899 [Myripristis murdjan]
MGNRLKHKQSLFNGYYAEAPLYKRKCLAGLNGLLHWSQDHRSSKATDQEGRTADVILKATCGHTCPLADFVNGEPKYPSGTRSFSEQISCWADTQYSVRKVLSHLKLKQAIDDTSFQESVNKKFLEFHRDITEECGAEDKQHSWAVIEKHDEILMYGPYYPNYNNGKHSEDTIIKQTQELLESESVSEDWTVYVFTMNSPCLARNTDPCMLTLVQKAEEWWRLYGVKTNIGYVKCWGFKGTKENLFRDINYRQLDCIRSSPDYGSYIKAAQESPKELTPLCKDLYCAVKQLLHAGQVDFRFPLVTTMQGQDWRSCFKNMHSILECEPEDKRETLTQDINTAIEAAQLLLSEEHASVEEYLQRGRTFALDDSFSSQACDQTRLAFQQCWMDMVQDKYAEFIREKLTEDFNQRAVQLFIKDIARFTKEYIQIGRVQLSEAVS